MPRTSILSLLGLMALTATLHSETPASSPVALEDKGKTLILSNGLVTATIDKGSSTIDSIRYKSFEMVSPGKPVYYSMGGGKSYRQPTGAAFRIVKQTPQITDVAFLQKWKPGNDQAVDIEVHYALKQGESGVYTYATLSHPAEYPATAIGEWRMVWGMPAKDDQSWLMEKIRVDKLRAWEMPSPADLKVAKPTGIKEIVELTKGVRAGMFDCKYDFNLEYYSVGCWGHASDRNQVGAWIVLGSHEFFNDGPMKQDLSSASSLIHIHFGRNHYDGSSTRLEAGETWKKLYGPFLLYCNSSGNADALWNDARAKSATERRAWPHDWLDNSELYPQKNARGTVKGHLTIRDALKPQLNSAGAWIGLAQPEKGGNWQSESKRYQHWAKVDAQGDFEIPNVRPGTYTLYAFNDGAVGEFEMPGAIVKPGLNPTGELVWTVPRIGKSLAWEIGTPDRRATEFRKGNDYFHGYVWTNFSKELKNPLIYTVGKSNPATDWNFAQGGYMVNGKAVAWPWQVQFQLAAVPASGNARLILAWASSDGARVELNLNGKSLGRPVYPPNGGGNALLREGIHAKYGLSQIDIPVGMLKQGSNVLTLTQGRNDSPANHVMYDYLALEMP